MRLRDGCIPWCEADGVGSGGWELRSRLHLESRWITRVEGYVVVKPWGRRRRVGGAIKDMIMGGENLQLLHDYGQWKMNNNALIKKIYQICRALPPTYQICRFG